MNKLKYIKEDYINSNLHDKLATIGLIVLVFTGFGMITYPILMVIQNQLIAFVIAILISIYASYAILYVLIRPKC